RVQEIGLGNLQVGKADPVPALALSGFKIEAGTGSAFPTCEFLCVEGSWGVILIFSHNFGSGWVVVAARIRALKSQNRLL
ncbi:MAG: hypothetical protein ND866_02400, partial [Pyrinomonadaceae bacterium]|nr:hypothetical protein [Pyrinomonadaceae bacterium]